MLDNEPGFTYLLDYLSNKMSTSVAIKFKRNFQVGKIFSKILLTVISVLFCMEMLLPSEKICKSSLEHTCIRMIMAADQNLVAIFQKAILVKENHLENYINVSLNWLGQIWQPSYTL